MVSMDRKDLNSKKQLLIKDNAPPKATKETHLSMNNFLSAADTFYHITNLQNIMIGVRKHFILSLVLRIILNLLNLELNKSLKYGGND